ncbi:MAG: DUF3887 domain-containing protein [Rhodanobacteraceae bacterium]|nr:MAG: DUF3887 domain-containing protein [Rhodanobacteraceae bacterium]
MYRTLIVAILLAAPVPAFAAGQHPSATARPHPSFSAHANAMAGQADAARIEACGHLSDAMLGALDKGEYKAATSDFDARMQAGLDPGKLAKVWASVGTQLGKLETRGTPQTVMYEGIPVITTPLQFEKGNLAAQVACDNDGKVAGFYLRPVASSALQ